MIKTEKNIALMWTKVQPTLKGRNQWIFHWMTNWIWEIIGSLGQFPVL